MQVQDSRVTKGMEISEQGRIAENPDGSFSVPSQASERLYHVVLLRNEWTCDCADFFYRHVTCKHVYAVKFWLTVNHYAQDKAPSVLAPDAVQCPRCGSIKVMRYGHSCGKQVYKCRDCGKKMREQSLIKKARYDPEVIVMTLDLYFKGLSLRKIADHLKQFNGLDVSFQAVHYWLSKYVPLLNDYVSTLTPQLSGKWHEDEMAVRAKGGAPRKDVGQWKWLWNVMDKGTRFQLASEISTNKTEANSAQAFLKAKEIAKALPHEVVTDKAGMAPRGVRMAFGRGAVKHTMINTGIGYPNGNQWAERLNNTVRERTKIQRGWKSDGSPIREGQRLYYNFIREHQGLGGLTPAEMAGLYQASGQNRWMELLKRALAD
jgi:transposase-like protein